MNIKQQLQETLKKRILILDGAMGTMIQQFHLEEKDYRGDLFKNWHLDVKGNNDLLCLTQPDIIEKIHLDYLNAGADIIETNTFNAQRISLADYDMQEYAVDINHSAVKIARRAVEAYKKVHPNAQKYIAGAIGPMNKMLSLSPDVNNPGFRAVSFDEVADAYYEQIKALDEAGADILLIETIFDSLNAKAAIYAIEQYYLKANKEKLSIMISGTITDASGRTLSGQTLEAFYISMLHVAPLSIGFNCALGAEQMRPYIKELSTLSNCYTSAYPNAGLPNAMGEYDEQPEQTAAILESFAAQGWINIVGGCCGTTPQHIKLIREAMAHQKPRVL